MFHCQSNVIYSRETAFWLVVHVLPCVMLEQPVCLALQNVLAFPKSAHFTRNRLIGDISVMLSCQLYVQGDTNLICNVVPAGSLQGFLQKTDRFVLIE